MDTAKAERVLLWLLSVSACFVALFPALGTAEVEFGSAISVGFARTDNVFLTHPDRVAETVYQLMPSFELRQQSTRLASELSVEIDAYQYASTSENEVYNRFDGQTVLALDPDNFLFEIGASRYQSIRDPRLAIPTSTLPLNTNQIDRDEAFAGPAFQYPLGRNVTASGSFRRTWIRYDEAEFDEDLFHTRNTDTDSFLLSFDNYRRQRGATWALRYSSEKTDYRIFEPWTYRQALVELGVWVAKGLRLFVSGGKETPWDDPFDTSLEDTLWEAGLTKTVGERLTIEVAAGERTFGSSRRGNIDIQFRRGETSFSYTEEPTAQELDPYRRAGVFDPSLPVDLLAEAGLAQRFVSKRLQWNLTFELRRTELYFDIFDETREDRVLLSGTPVAEVDQSGASLGAARRLGARTRVRLEARRWSRQYEQTGDIDLTELLIGASYDIGTRTRLTLEYEHTEEEPEAGVRGSLYSVNTVSLLLTRSFF